MRGGAVSMKDDSGNSIFAATSASGNASSWYYLEAILPASASIGSDKPVAECAEGGAIDVNGRGTLLTTEECLLDPETQVRNPGLSREGTEEALREHLGVRNIVWLGKGIAGADTHGHGDDLGRFVNEATVVLCEELGRINAGGPL